MLRASLILLPWETLLNLLELHTTGVVGTGLMGQSSVWSTDFHPTKHPGSLPWHA